MILLDTNVVIDALDPGSPYHAWANKHIVNALSGEGAAVNAVTVAELCAGDRNPKHVESDLRRWGVQVLDVPAAAATICSRAYRRYALARRASGGGAAPKTPLPDFFIGAHAEMEGWKLVTRDTERISRYFPSAMLLTP